jgi:hypothetical protein
VVFDGMPGVQAALDAQPDDAEAKGARWAQRDTAPIEQRGRAATRGDDAVRLKKNRSG